MPVQGGLGFGTIAAVGHWISDTLLNGSKPPPGELVSYDTDDVSAAFCARANTSKNKN
ncbi:hypothetical protein L537_0110 [Bordetella hinzii 1277]|nr:hypothetical protein L537_0110 [Bordetella hinzii 1277]